MVDIHRINRVIGQAIRERETQRLIGIHSDRQRLRDLNFTPVQLAVYQDRIAGIEMRLEAKIREN